MTLPTQTGTEHDTLKVMISTTTADSPGKILDWMRYHRLLGWNISFCLWRAEQHGEGRWSSWSRSRA